ncbi:uncharacterized protein FIBRA_02691 [Fibroporia radiculosa]|uniref:Zn(2)-C6 fungal-type domain-containing protein n=1 Tax=Fibroporia radiculosa TaxID=599839 RepID=J4G2C3_9APHY|nr:uncharacterized protein FIBRA_02691 [Fibroporia radiculosa]CCM00653.1 predicted protein [Fibroporia radiculosa]
MVAGRRTGKTSFLRLLLDTSLVAPSVSRDQLVSVAKFVQGCSGHTSHVRSVSVAVDLAPADPDEPHLLNLTLIDTPSLDYDDDPAAQRAVDDILRHVDARFAESIEDDRKARTGDHHVHLCIYFLDPECIVPPSVSAPPVPLVSRARANSLSAPDAEPVILEPPVTTNPLLCRPTLPAADIATIRRLSARVNVLPVVARADVLSNDRLAAVKLAIRRDLAEAGIGFGIFDVDSFPQYSQRDTVELTPPARVSEPPNGYKHANGVSSTAASPPSPPVSPSFLRLPFALISPDIYSHSDGVSRVAPSRHELALQYTPLQQHPKLKQPLTKIIPGKFIRSYRWGFLDVMDVNHCDFIHLRGAIFHHMQTLQKYTKEYLFQKFRNEMQPPHPMPTRAAQPSNSAPPPPQFPHSSRPILAIDTTPTHATSKRQPPPQPAPRAGIAPNGDAAPSAVSPQPPPAVSESSPRTATSSRSQRSRTKKITVACNFCRSRKLKCDGGRPACSQCHKRSNPCDYMASTKRRRGKSRKQFGDSESEGESMEDQSVELENPSESPEVLSRGRSRRNSSVSMLLTENLPPLGTAMDRPEDTSNVLPSIAQATMAVPLPEPRPELPPIVTLSASPANVPREETATRSSAKPDQGHMIQTQRRRNASTAPGKGRTNHGSKIVACNLARQDATAHIRRAEVALGDHWRATTSTTPIQAEPVGEAPFPSSGAPEPTNGYTRRISAVDSGTADHSGQPAKKMRMAAAESGRSALAVAQP